MPAKEKKRIKPVIEEVVEDVTAPQPLVEATQADETAAPDLSVDLPPVETTPSQVAKKSESKLNFKTIFAVTTISALVAAFVSGGVYVYLSGLEQLPESTSEVVLEPEPSPEALVTPEPTPESESAVDVSKYSIQVLNGSGVAGAASNGQEVLEEAGFSVSSIGNASSSNFKTTQLQVKSSVSAEVVQKIKSVLEDGEYGVDIGSALPDTSRYDIVITIGAD